MMRKLLLILNYPLVKCSFEMLNNYTANPLKRKNKKMIKVEEIMTLTECVKIDDMFI